MPAQTTPLGVFVNSAELNAHRHTLALPLHEFWMRYSALGGRCDLVEFEAALNGVFDLSQEDLVVAESALFDAEWASPPTAGGRAAEMRARSAIMRHRTSALNARIALLSGSVRAQHARAQTFRSQLLAEETRPLRE